MIGGTVVGVTQSSQRRRQVTWNGSWCRLTRRDLPLGPFGQLSSARYVAAHELTLHRALTSASQQLPAE